LWDGGKRKPDKDNGGKLFVIIAGRLHIVASNKVCAQVLYFIMLGLQESNRYDMIENMVEGILYISH